MLFWLLACVGAAERGSQVKDFARSIVDEFECGSVDHPCEIRGGRASDGSGELWGWDCEGTDWETHQTPDTSGSAYMLYGDGGGEFQNAFNMRRMSFWLPKADPAMVELIDQVDRLACDTIPDAYCSESTCGAVVRDGRVIVTRKQF